MSAFILLALIAALIAGLLLVWFGLRGRRINRDPVCRDCGFNLGAFRLPEMHGWKAATVARNETPESATQPITVTCPECGGGLKRSKAVRIGERRRMPVVAIAGLVIFLAPCVPLGAFGFTVLTGQSLARLPFGLVVLQSRFASGEYLKGIAVEIERRILANALSKDQIRAAVDRVLEIQKDWDNPWFEEWGQVIEAAKAVGEFSPEQDAEWEANAPRIELVARSPVRAGDFVRVYAISRGAHTSPHNQSFYYVSVESATIGGLDATTKETTGWARPLHSGERLGQISYQGSKVNPNVVMGTFSSSDGVLRVPEKLPTGEYEVDVLVARMTGNSRASLDASHPRQRLQTRIQITARDSAGIEIVAPSGSLDAQVRATLEPKRAKWVLDIGPKFDRENRKWIYEPEMVWQLDLEFFSGRPNPPVDLAMEVFAIDQAGKETKVGTLTTEPGHVRDLADAIQKAKTRSYRQVTFSMMGLAEPIPGPLSIVFRASERVAQETLGISKIYGGAVRFDDVAVSYSRSNDKVGASSDSPTKEPVVEGALKWFEEWMKREGRR